MLFHRCTLAALAALAPVSLSAQSAPPDSSGIIRAVEVRRLNVFGPAEANSFIPRLANKLHATTRAHVVQREILFRAGEPYDSATVQETARNLRTLGLFRRVLVDSVRSDSGLVVRVVTGDGWSMRPMWGWSNVGSKSNRMLGIADNNFLGTGNYVALRFQWTPDRSAVTAQFRAPRLLPGRTGLQAQHQDRSDGRLDFAALSKPFYALSDRWSWSLAIDDRRNRILRFFNGSADARDSLQRRYTNGFGSSAWALHASSRGYLRLGVSGQIRRDNYAAEAAVDTLGRTVTGAFGGFLQWRRARFVVSTGLQGFGREEDIDVGTAVGVGFNLTPDAFGYAENGIVPAVGIRTGFGRIGRFVQLFANASGRFTSAGLDSGSVHLAGTTYLQPWPRHLLVLHAAHGWQRRPAPGAEFDLGLGLGPRAYRQHSFTGDRAFFTMAEYRYTLSEEFLKLSAVGLAGFVEYGGAWYHDTPRRTGWDVGMGLRFGITRSPVVRNTRVDVIYRGKTDIEKSGITYSLGLGFPFSANGRLDLGQ
jgi:hypothetical protein